MLLRTESERVYECLDVSTHDRLIERIQQLLIVDGSRKILHHPDFQTFIQDA